MRILTRYLLQAHLGPFFFAFVALTGVVLINTLAKRLAELAGKGLPLGVILEFFVLALPAAVALTFPMAVLVAVLYTFSTFTAENEIMALKASGVDLRRLLVPLLVAAGAITGIMVWFNDRVLPESNFKWSQLYLDIARKTPTLILAPQTLNRIAPSNATGQVFYMRAARIEPGTNRLWDVSIYDVTNPSMVRTIYADSGRALFNRAQTDLVMRLFSGHMREVSLDDPKVFRRIDFQEQRFGIPGVGNLLQAGGTGGAGYRGDREMTIGMLAAHVDTLARDRRASLKRAREIATRDLALALPGAKRAAPRVSPSSGIISPEAGDARERARRTADELQASRRRAADLEREISDYQVEIHKKYSIAVASLVFVLVGVPLALRFGGGGIGMVIATSMVIFSVYYVGLIGGESLAGRGFVKPWLAMWIVNAVMAVVGVLGLATTGRESATGRTSAWEGIVQALRGLTGRRAEA
ncbi:MAG TPA: LptF/LptG family permease [Longimicrobium sp.]|jgi:lipopolysaccharide export system permease protein